MHQGNNPQDEQTKVLLEKLVLSPEVQERLVPGYPKVLPLDNDEYGQFDDNVVVVLLYSERSPDYLRGRLYGISEELNVYTRCGTSHDAGLKPYNFVDVFCEQKQLSELGEASCRVIAEIEDVVSKTSLPPLCRKDLFLNYIASQITWDDQPVDGNYVVSISTELIPEGNMAEKMALALQRMRTKPQEVELGRDKISIRIPIPPGAEGSFLLFKAVLEGELVAHVLEYSHWREAAKDEEK